MVVPHLGISIRQAFSCVPLKCQTSFQGLIRITSGEGNGTPLQHSCLENPMDGGAWQAAVHGVARSLTRLSDSLSLFTFMHWRRKWQPTPVFLPGESQGRGSLVGYRLWGRTELDTTEATQQQQQQNHQERQRNRERKREHFIFKGVCKYSHQPFKPSYPHKDIRDNENEVQDPVAKALLQTGVKIPL